MTRLFSRRQVWLPTFRGALLILVVASAGVILLARGLGTCLFVNDPAQGRDGHGARVLVVEGWLDEDELTDAIAAFRRGGYERVVTTGGPIESWRESGGPASYAERAADYLKRHGLADAVVVAAPAAATAQDRTFLSAVVVREWAARERPGLDAIDVHSAGVHARRSRLVYRMAFGPTVEVGILAATPRRYEADRWWRTSEGAKSVLGEALSLAWTRCCFWPPAPGT